MFQFTNYNFYFRFVSYINHTYVHKLKCFPNFQYIKHFRCLYDAASLNVEAYTTTRNTVLSQMPNINNFREKMYNNCNSEFNSMIFTDDIKLMTHIAESTDDLILLEKMILKFNKQNIHLRFGNYIFGPIVMRMYYFLNRPNEALKIFNTEELCGFFDQLSSYLILMDLLFKNEMYVEVTEVYNTMRNKQLIFGKHPKYILLLVFAASYKMNSQNSLNYMIDLWKEMKESGHIPLTKTICFGATLALNQNNPNLSFEMISLNENDNIIIKSIKALSFCAIGKYKDSFSIFNDLLETDKPHILKQILPHDVINSIAELVEQQSSKRLLYEFNRIRSQLHEFKYLSTQTLDDLLCSEIHVDIPANRSKSVLDAAFNDAPKKLRKSNNREVRHPGLHEMI